MVKISRFSIYLITILLLITLIITATTIELNRQHEQKLIYAMETKIEYYAKRCYIEKNCNGEISIQDLYDRNYLTQVIHPVTKEVIDSTTKIEYIDSKITIKWN